MDEPGDETSRLIASTKSKADAAAMLGCSTKTLERRTENMTPAQGRIPIGGLKRPAEIRYTPALIASLMPAPGGEDVPDAER